MKKVMLAAVLVATGLPASAYAQSVMGTWLPPAKTAEIRLTPCVDAMHGPICGTLAKLIDPKGPDGKPAVPEQITDERNADPGLRQRKLIGVPILYGFKPGSSPNTYEEGTIYNAENGKTYKATVSLQADGTLRVRGYIGSPMLGETQIWTRVQ